jgi:protein-tyrosine phosphatase
MMAADGTVGRTGAAAPAMRRTATMNILVVCTGNICRSPMAEGMLRQRLSQQHRRMQVRVHSAGTHGLDGEPAAAFAVQAAQELGVDITAHRARSLDREMVRGADLILVMEPFHRELIGRALTPGEQKKLRLLAHFDVSADSDTIEDPYHQPLEAYRDCARRIARCVAGVVQELN